MNLNRFILFIRFMLFPVILLFSLPLSVSLSLQGDKPSPSQTPGPGIPPWQAIGKYTHPPIEESSGVVASRRFPGVYWTLNDSGHPPALFATTLKGELIREFLVPGANNHDWEDLAIDDKGQLWIGDIGNNLRLRNDLSLYVVPEPDPFKDTEIKVIAQYPYRYPDNNVDAEGMFVFDGLPYIVSKEFTKAVLYRFTTLKIREVNVLKRLGELAGARFITGADISPDGKRLALCTYNAVWIYHDQKDIAQLVNSQPWSFSHLFGVEAIGFDGYDLVMTSESRNIYRLPRWWYERELKLPPADTLSAFSLMATTKAEGAKLKTENYREAGIDIDGVHVILAAKSRGAAITQIIQLPRDDRYELNVVLTRGPEYARVEVLVDGKAVGSPYDCYAVSAIPGSMVTFGSVYLAAGSHEMKLQIVGKSPNAQGYKVGIDSYLIRPNSAFAPQYLVLGPFSKADLNNIDAPLPPEQSKKEELLNTTFQSASGRPISWQRAEAEPDGHLDLQTSLGKDWDKPAVGYALTYVYSPKARKATLLVGSDDEVAIWVNGKEAHRHNIARGAAPDQDIVSCHLKAGWNEVLCKIGQNVGGWALYLRLNDPDGSLKYTVKP